MVMPSSKIIIRHPISQGLLYPENPNFHFLFSGYEAQWKARQLKLHGLTLLYGGCTLQRNSQLQ